MHVKCSARRESGSPALQQCEDPSKFGRTSADGHICVRNLNRMQFMPWSRVSNGDFDTDARTSRSRERIRNSLVARHHRARRRAAQRLLRRLRWWEEA